MVMSKLEIGKLVREARIKKGLSLGGKFTQQMLADTVEKSRSYIGDIESGRIYPNYVLLVEIAEACSVQLSFFGEMDTVLDNIIKKNYPVMMPEERIDFAKYIGDHINNGQNLDLEFIKLLYDDFNFNKISYTEEHYHPTELEVAEANALYDADYSIENFIDSDMLAIMAALKNASPKKKAKVLKMIELFEDEN